jgi:hypothetical protein
MKPKRTVATLAATLLTFGSLANGAVTVSNIGGTQYLADIGTIAFNVTTSGLFRAVTVEDFYTGPNVDTSSTPLVSNIFYSINGGSATALSLTTNSGSYGDTFGIWDPNDFVFASLTGIPVSIGDSVVFTGTFTFDAFGLTAPALVAGDLDTYLSDVTLGVNFAAGTVNAVPEPSSVMLLGLGALGVMARRRRTK